MPARIMLTRHREKPGDTADATIDTAERVSHDGRRVAESLLVRVATGTCLNRAGRPGRLAGSGQKARENCRHE
jgi:hypothetical protein